MLSLGGDPCRNVFPVGCRSYSRVGRAGAKHFVALVGCAFARRERDAAQQTSERGCRASARRPFRAPPRRDPRAKRPRDVEAFKPRGNAEYAARGHLSAQPPMAGMGSGESGAVGAGCMGAGCMGAGRRKEFYPSLMALPTLSPEQRQRVEAEARSFISAGTDEIASAENALRQAIAAGDTVGAEQAASRLRDALNHVKSGTTTLRSLAEGKPPQQIAFDWFKEQMNLAPDAFTHESVGPLGLSWFHLITMSLVAALAAAMLIIYILRMRRANALVTRLTTGSPAPGARGAPAAPPATAAGPAGPDPPSTPAAAKSAASAPPSAPTDPARSSNTPAIAPPSSPRIRGPSDRGPVRCALPPFFVRPRR